MRRFAILGILAGCGPSAAQAPPPAEPEHDAILAEITAEPKRPDGRHDKQTELVWAPEPGPSTPDRAAASTWCEEQPDGPWRLPSRWELRSMLTADKFEYRTEFADMAKREGYIFSSDDVSEEREGEPWVLNLRNGVIFNGAGNDAMPWCVNGEPHEWHPIVRPSQYDPTLSGEIGAINVELTCQFDATFCKKAYKRLLKLGKKAHVTLRHIRPTDALYERQVAACAAAIQGKLPRMAAMLFENAKKDPDKEDVRVYAEHIGLDMAKFDADSEELCPRIIEDDIETIRHLDRPPVTGVPSAFIDGEVFDGRQIKKGAVEKKVRKYKH